MFLDSRSSLLGATSTCCRRLLPVYSQFPRPCGHGEGPQMHSYDSESHAYVLLVSHRHGRWHVENERRWNWLCLQHLYPKEWVSTQHRVLILFIYSASPPIVLVGLWPRHTANGAVVRLQRSPPFFWDDASLDVHCTGRLLGTVILQNWFNKDPANIRSCLNAARRLSATWSQQQVLYHCFHIHSHLISLAGSLSRIMRGSGIDIPLWELTGTLTLNKKLLNPRFWIDQRFVLL